MLTFDQVPDGEAFFVSATLYTTYLECPQQALERLLGRYPKPSRAGFKGALAHRVFARHLTAGPIDEDDFQLACREETGANLNQQLAAIGLRPSEFDGVVREVDGLYRRFAALPLDDVTGVEVPFEEAVAEGIVLRGRIDAVRGSSDAPTIVDWKTGTHLGSAVTAQLEFYALAWRVATGHSVAAVEALSVPTGERLRIEPDDASLDRLEDSIVRMIVELRRAMAAESDLPRTAGPFCRWCAVVDDCPEGSAAMALLD